MWKEFGEKEWCNIARELSNQSKCKIRDWQEVKNRFKKIIVSKFDDEASISRDDMTDLRLRKKIKSIQ
eukprot:UN31836